MAPGHLTVRVTDIDEFLSTLRREYKLISIVPTILQQIESAPGEPAGHPMADDGPARRRYMVTEWVAVMRYEPA